MMEVLNEIREDLKTKSTSAELQELVTKLEEKEVRIAALESSLATVDERSKLHDERLNDLEKRIDGVDERRIAILENTVSLLERKCDDHEQVSRKVNLRVVGIEIRDGESPDTLLDIIKVECTKLGLPIDDADFDHCHRNGKIITTAGGRKQTVLLKMRSWRGRNVIYGNRHKFPFKIYNDLTLRRRALLGDANEMIASPDVKRVVEYAMADKNCKLKLKSTSGRYLHFNSIAEFTSAVHGLQNERDGLQDERDELYH